MARTGSAVPKNCHDGAKLLGCRANFLVRVNGVLILRVNVTKNQRKFKKSRTRTENRFGLFCICSKLEVCNKVKWG